MKEKIQFVTDVDGKRQSAIIPIELFERLIEEADLDDFYESIPYAKGEHDNEAIPHDVVSSMLLKDVSLPAAWRLYREMSQQEVADKLGVSQAAIAALEKVGKKPQKATLEKLANLYNCRLGQITPE